MNAALTLDRLRRELATRFAQADSCVLATTGPAGVQASRVRCGADGLELLITLDAADDHLVNLEVDGGAALVGEGWRLHGQAQRLAEDGLVDQPWQVVVRVRPDQAHLLGPAGEVVGTLDLPGVESYLS